VKIQVDDKDSIVDVSYKLYDLLRKKRFKAQAAISLDLNSSQPQFIQLNARRILSISWNRNLPQDFIGNTFRIDLVEIINDLNLRGF
jgi:hypothetical protein